MRKSHSSRSDKPGAKSNFKGSDRPSGKDSKPFKKNYDGRGPSGSSQGDKPYRSSKPYSGRAADGDSAGKPREERKSFDKPFGKDSRPGSRSGGDFKPRKDFDKSKWADKEDGNGERKPRKEFGGSGGFERKPRRDDDKGGFERKPRKEFDGPRSRDDRDGAPRGPRKEFDGPRSRDDRDGAPRGPRKEYDKPRSRDDREGGERKPRREDGPRKSFGDKPKGKFGAGRDGGKPDRDGDRGGKKREDSRPFRQRPDPFREGPERPKKEPDVISFSKDIDDANAQEEKPFKPKRFSVPKREEEDTDKPKAERTPVTKKGRKKHFHDHTDDEEEEDTEINQKSGPRLEMPLNKYIAHSGECSRRDAAEMVKSGKVKVNGELVLEPGYRVQPNDQVSLSGKKLTPQKDLIYILLNKPKGFITTNEDPQGRKTVMDLVANSGEDRIYPVGRLDKETSGLLLMTNDGELTQKLSHPSYNIKKVYQVTLDKPVTKADFEKIVAGVELEDGLAIVDEIAYLEAKNEIGLEIHSGRNRIVRRIFESLGYVVEKLDRVMYAGLTKKNLPRSKWRHLTEREIVLLRHFKN